MADVYTRIGYIKGATGATGATGAKGDTGDAATIQVGSVTTVPYGQTANVVNSGTEQAAVFDFTIPQGRPGQQVTEMDNLLLNSITTSAAEFPLPAVGETGKVLWGKVVKWFSDMAALVASKFDAANVVNNLTTTSSGYALDARQGKVLSDKTNTMFMGITTLERCSIHISGPISSGLVYLDFTFDSPLHITPSRLFIGMPQTSTMFVTAFALSATGGKLRLYNFGDAYQANNMALIGIAMNP